MRNIGKRNGAQWGKLGSKIKTDKIWRNIGKRNAMAMAMAGAGKHIMTRLKLRGDMAVESCVMWSFVVRSCMV